MDWIKKTFIYNWVRIYKSRILDRSYIELLKKINVNKEFVAIHNVKKQLAGKPVVLGIGHMDWEKYGFWKTFESRFDFSFFKLTSTIKDFNLEMRSKINTELRIFLDTLLKEKRKVDMVFLYCDASYIEPEFLELIREKRIVSVMMGLDDKHRLQKHNYNNVPAGQEMLIPYLDYYWTTWKTAVSYITEMGAKGIYLAEGADPEFHKRDDSYIKDIDVLFLGNAYGHRKQIVEFLIDNGINVEAYGAGWSNGFVSFEKTIELYNRSKIVLGVGGVGHSLNFKHLKGRDFEATMCGCFYLTSYNPELTDWFQIGKEIVCYSSDIEMLEQIKYYLNSEDERMLIAEHAYERSLSNHTWNHRINTLLTQIYEIT